MCVGVCVYLCGLELRNIVYMAYSVYEGTNATRCFSRI